MKPLAAILDGQLSIDDLPMFRNTDPATSREAAVIALETAPNLRERCHQALVAAGPEGLDDFALAAVVGRGQTSAGKRRLDLVRQGRVAPLIRWVDGRWQQVRRLSPSGSPTLVWVAAEYVEAVS